LRSALRRIIFEHLNPIVPALPGCYSQGETMDELMMNIREAVTGALEVMRARGATPESNIRITWLFEAHHCKAHPN
jgi:hypothetical protein